MFLKKGILPIKALFFQNLPKWADFLIIYRNGPFSAKSRPRQRDVRVNARKSHPRQRDLLTWTEIAPTRTRFADVDEQFMFLSLENFERP